MSPSHQRIVEWLALVHSESSEAECRDKNFPCLRKRKRKQSSSVSVSLQHQRRADTNPETHFTTMPTTPPPSNTADQLSLRPNSSTSTVTNAREQQAPREESSPKKRRIYDNNYDVDRTPTAASSKSASLHRPIITPRRSSRPRNTSPIKSVNSLRQLQKPVHVISLGNSSKDLLPEDAYSLYRDIRRHMNSGFVPAPVREDFLQVYGSEADLVPDAWFFEPELQAGESKEEQKTALVTQLRRLTSIQLVACESAQLGRSEPSWNCKVHQPLLDMACGDAIGMPSVTAPGASASMAAYRVRAENVSAATITGDCVPRLWAEAAPDAVSIPACSVTASSTSSASGDGYPNEDVFHDSPTWWQADSHVHSRFGSKKVDFALVVSVADDTPFRAAIDRVTQALALRALLAADHKEQGPAPSQSINPTSYAPLFRDPMAVVIETKSTTASNDPLVQLSFMVAALHRRLVTLSSPGRPLPVRVIPTILAISVVDHHWTVYFAVDRRSRIVSLL